MRSATTGFFSTFASTKSLMRHRSSQRLKNVAASLYGPGPCDTVKAVVAKLKVMATVLLTVGTLACGTAVLLHQGVGAAQSGPKRPILPKGAAEPAVTYVWRERAVLKDHGDLVHGVAFAPGGRLFATAGSDRTVKLWETDTHRVKATLRGH